MSKFLRDLKRIAGEEGYVYEGYAGSDSSGSGSGHHVFIDPASGAVVRTSSTPRSEGNTIKNARANFRRSKKTTTTAAAAFRRFMLKKYKVGKGGQKVVYVTVRDLVDEFNATHPTTPITNGHLTVMIGQDPMFERISHSKGGGTRGSTITELRISGPTYGLTKEPDEPELASDPCGQTFQTPSKGIAICTLAKGHTGLHFDSFRNTRWAEGSGVQVAEQAPAEPVIDPVAAAAQRSLPKLSEQVSLDEIHEPTQTPAPAVLEPVMVGGLTLSDELADQLRAALGVPDAAIAAENQDAAIAALEQATQALQTAMDAIKGLAVLPVRGRMRKQHASGEIGTMRRERLNQVVAAQAEGKLAETFTVTDVVALFGWSDGQVVSMLARAHATGDTVRRVAPNTYQVR